MMLAALRKPTSADTPFERLWKAQRPRIQRLACRLCGDPERAEDLTQEIGLQALAAFPTFRRECAPTTFLYRIAVRTIQRHRESHFTVGLEHAENLPSQSASPEASLALAVALESLPDELRMTLLSRLHTARERLRKELNDHAL